MKNRFDDHLRYRGFATRYKNISIEFDLIKKSYHIKVYASSRSKEVIMSVNSIGFCVGDESFNFNDLELSSDDDTGMNYLNNYYHLGGFLLIALQIRKKYFGMKSPYVVRIHPNLL